MFIQAQKFNNDKYWTSLNSKINLSKFLKIGLDKSDEKEFKMMYFLFSKINGCELFKNSKCKNSIFYIERINKRIEVLMEFHKEKNNLSIKYNKFWNFFENEFKVSDVEISYFLRTYLELAGIFKEINEVYSSSFSSITSEFYKKVNEEFYEILSIADDKIKSTKLR